MDQDQVLTHVRRGTSEYCTLASLRGDERYAGDLVGGLDGVLVSGEGVAFGSKVRRNAMV